MELHIAIKNLVKYKDQDFINEPQFINALVDFNAFENYPALKNITRILLNDGYGHKVMALTGWTTQAQTMVADVVRSYSFDSSLVEYVLKSIAYGTGIINSVEAPTQNGGSTQNSSQNTPTAKPSAVNLNLSQSQLEKLDDEDRYNYKSAAEQYLNSIIVRKGDWEKELGAEFNVSSQFDTDGGYLCFNIEIDGKIKKEYLEFNCVVYGKNGNIIEKLLANTSDARRKSYQVLNSQTLYSDDYRFVGNISKVLIYWDE